MKGRAAELRDRLTGALIGLARATEGNEHMVRPSTDDLVVEGLAATLAHGNLDPAALEGILDRVAAEKRRLVPDCFYCACPCGRTADYDIQRLWQAEENVRSLKFLLLSGIRGMAALPGPRDEAFREFLYKALIAIGIEEFSVEELLPILLEMGRVNLRYMTLPEQNGGEARQPE